MPQPPRTPQLPGQLLVPHVPCSQHHGTEVRPAVPQANLQMSLNYCGRWSCCTPTAKLCITDELLQHLAGSKRHSSTAFPKQWVHKPSPLFKHDLAGRQPQHPPQRSRLDLVINSFILALLIFYEITKKELGAKWRAEGNHCFFQQLFTIRSA